MAQEQQQVPKANGTMAPGVGQNGTITAKTNIYIPPDRCHTRERDYARANGVLGQAPAFTLNTSADVFQYEPNFENAADDDFWARMQQPTSLRRMSSIPVPVGAKPVGVGKNGSSSTRKGHRLSLREVVQKLRQRISIMSASPARPSSPVKISRGTSAGSISRVGSQKHGNWEESENEKADKEYGIGAKMAAEFSGDFCLVFLSSLSALGTDAVTGRLHAAIATGLTIFVMVASVGQISGGHFNPAVSLAVALAGKISCLQMVLYWLAQLSGGFVGALFIRAVTNSSEYENIAGGATLLNPSQSWFHGLLCEAILTAILVQTILNGAVETPNNPLAPLAIGCTVMVDIVGAYVLLINLIPTISGAISGASMNPARSLGPCLAATFLSGKMSASDIWMNHFIFWIGPFLGSLCSAIFYRFVFSAQRENET